MLPALLHRNLHLPSKGAMMLRGGTPRSFILVALLFFCWPLPAQDGLSAGTRAPDIELPALSGTHISLASYLNKNIVVLHFWKLR
jgi:hypothetical protein